MAWILIEPGAMPFRSSLLVVAVATLLPAVTGCTAIVKDIVEEPVKENVTRPAIDEASSRAGGWQGEWVGTWNDENGTVRPARATLTQNGLVVDGVVTLEGNPCFPENTLHAEVNDEGLVANLKAGGADLEYRASFFDGKEQRGELTLVEPALCVATKGSKAAFTLSKRAAK